MLVNITVIDLGLNLACWMSSTNMFKWEAKKYPNLYVVKGEFSTWSIRSNFELTNKMLKMCVETGEKISDEQITKNNKRKIGK
jgi:hypothetical protein